MKKLLLNVGSITGYIALILAVYLYYQNQDKTAEKIVSLEPGAQAEFYLPKETTNDSTLRKEWEKHYQTYYGQSVDFSNVAIPKKPDFGSYRLLFIAKGLTMNAAFRECKKQFACSSYENDLDANVTFNVRTAKDSSYAVWVKDNVEPDPDKMGYSANQADPDKKGITLLERIVFELKYYAETGKHLDKDNWTLCSGSRFSDGHVPYTYWSWFGRFEVGWSYPDFSYSFLGLRSAVSL